MEERRVARRKKNNELGCGASLLLLLFGVGVIWLLATVGKIWTLVICIIVFSIIAWFIWHWDDKTAKQEKPVRRVLPKKSKGWQQALDGAVASKEDRESLLLYKRSDADFEMALLGLLTGKPNPPLESLVNGNLWKHGKYDRAELFRSVQILRDCIYHALHSKKPDVAKSNFLGISSTMENVREKSYVISSETFSKIADAARNAEEKYHTVFYVNQVVGLEERAAKLKTRKAKLKYWAQAIDVLKDGIVTGTGDIGLLEGHIGRLESMMAEPSVQVSDAKNEN
jgi:hypothetical protein